MYQPLPDRPQSDLAVGQRYFTPAPQSGPVELYDERDPVVYVTDPYNPSQSVAVRRSQLQPATPPPARDLSPQPLFDPQAQRMIGAGFGGGALAAGAGWGAAQLINALAGGVTGLAVLALLLLAARACGPRGGDTVNLNQTVTNNNRWWGRSSTTL